MLLKYIDAITCPVCKASRLWKLDGDITDDRMANGKVVCKNNHVWLVTEEVFRLDQENAEEDMQFLNHPLTGFPKGIEEKVRGNFLQAFQKYVEEFVNKSDEPLVLIGSAILFIKYIPSTEREILIINSSEGILRQIQEITASKRMYKQSSMIRAENIDLLLPNAQVLYLFDQNPKKLNKNETVIMVERDAEASIIWEEDDSILMERSK